jgi:uncharacterized protein (DUF4415 family)
MESVRKQNEAALRGAIDAIPAGKRMSQASARRRFARLAAEADAELAALPQDRRVTAPRRGRPVGSDKTRITVRLDNDVLAWLKSQDERYQTLLNSVLRQAMHRAGVR